LRTSPRDAQIAEGQEKWKETIVIEVSAAEIVGNQKEEHMLFFFIAYGNGDRYLVPPWGVFQRSHQTPLCHRIRFFADAQNDMGGLRVPTRYPHHDK